MSVNPHGCCEVESECCENRLPDTLKATIANVSGCPNAEGVEIALDWVGGSWEGSKDCNGDPISLSIQCTAQMGGDCTLFSLDYSFGCTITGLADPDDGCSCDPLNLVYTILGDAASPCNCCDENESVELTVTITG